LTKKINFSVQTIGPNTISYDLVTVSRIAIVLFFFYRFVVNKSCSIL